MRSSRYILSIFLLLSVVMTAAAEDNIRLGGCRRGVQLTATTRSQRAQFTPQVGGDFYHGDRHQLVVLAAFRDRAFKDDETTTLTKWNKIFNAENYHEGAFEGSVHDYFYAQSYGQFNLMFDLFYVNLPDSAKRYRSTYSHDEYSQYMVDDIVDTLQTLNIDWSQYDWNGDGFVNQILIIFAGQGMNIGSAPNTIWPHQWWLSKHMKDYEKPDEGYRNYRTVISGDKQFNIDCYCCVQEDVNSSSTKTSFGTICHEYTHCFGFPDFYNGVTQYVGKWDIMDFGNYNKLGYCPTGYSAHERWLMGWCTPTELTSATEVSSMRALCDEPQAYLIRNDGYENEYYIIENRQQKGWDSYLPGSGLVVFHIDYDESIWVSLTEPTNHSSLKRYTIIPANNNKSTSDASSARWPFPYALSDSLVNDSLTNTSQPAAVLIHANTDGKKLMNKSLFDMKVEDGLGSFRFALGTPTAILERKTEGSPKELYRLGAVSILRYPNGEIKKVMKH